MDLADREKISDLFKAQHFEIVVNLASQAGVRYSLNPATDANLTGFEYFGRLSAYQAESPFVCIFSSVYGMNTKTPFSVSDITEYQSVFMRRRRNPMSLWHAYARLYGIPSTGLRFLFMDPMVARIWPILNLPRLLLRGVL